MEQREPVALMLKENAVTVKSTDAKHRGGITGSSNAIL